MPTKMRCAAATVSTLALAMTAQPALATTLQEALAQAYRTNPTLNAARAQLRAIDENVPIAKADGRPDAGAVGTYDEQLHRDFPGSTPRRSLSGQADVTVPVYQGGVVRNAIRAAKKSVAASEAELRGTESSVFAEVVAAYLDVITDSAVVTFNRQNVRSLEVNLQASTDRFNVGDLTRTDVAQSDTRLALARASLESAEAQLIASKERYIQLVGSEPVDLQAPPPLPGLPASPDSAIEVALRDNPDILAAKRTTEAAHYDVNSAKGQIAPRISGFVRGGYTDYLNSKQTIPTVAGPLSLPYGTAKSASAGVQITVPLYQGGRPGALARRAIARESQAIEQTVATERSVIAQTRSAYANWQASLQTIESTRKAVASGSLSLEGVQAENKAGTRTILDILDSQRDLLNAQVQYVSAQRNAYVAGFSLIAAMGHAEARDLSLDGGALYDPNAYYKTVRNKLFDFDFGGKATQVSTGTATTKPQDATIMPGGFGTQ